MSSIAREPVSIQLDYSRCQGCGNCIITCHTRAIGIDLGILVIDYSLCDSCMECVEVCPVDAFSTTIDTIKIHPIESKSYSIIQPILDELDLPRELLPLAARVLHATTDKELAESLWCKKDAVNQMVEAISKGYQIITDVEMTRSGLTGALKQKSICALSFGTQVDRDTGDYSNAPSVSAASMAKAANQYRNHALYVIGCAPTALEQLIDMIGSGSVKPAGVLALPVGFIGAEQAKHRLIEISGQCSFPVITNVGPKGGSAATAACMNAIYRIAVEQDRMPHE